jgi:rhodanese-related sulfurtransferase
MGGCRDTTAAVRAASESASKSENMAVEVPEVTAPEGADLVAAGALLLDVREPDEWDAGHAPTASHVPMREIPQRAGELPRDRRIVAICRSGARSRVVAEALIGAGFDVVNVSGGMRAWMAADLPVETVTGAAGTVA